MEFEITQRTVSHKVTKITSKQEYIKSGSVSIVIFSIVIAFYEYYSRLLVQSAKKVSMTVAHRNNIYMYKQRTKA